MIKIESIAIKELRGIRDLTLTLNNEPFVISGPNGSGKSGVVDAIQFALTGEMGRLKGAGTADITLAEHGPHVEKRDDPGAASVTLNVFIPRLKKKASITRTIKKAKTPLITPNDPAVKAAFAELAEHSEVTLSRREIIKFILTEAAKRSRDVQTLLKLDAIDETRATLKTTENKLGAEQATAKTVAETAEDSLKRHLDLSALKAEDVLAAVNKRRKVLGLSVLAELTKDTDVSEGIGQGAAEAGGGQNKESALADLAAVIQLTDAGLETPTQSTRELAIDHARAEPAESQRRSTRFLLRRAQRVVGYRVWEMEGRAQGGRPSSLSRSLVEATGNCSGDRVQHPEPMPGRGRPSLFAIRY